MPYSGTRPIGCETAAKGCSGLALQEAAAALFRRVRELAAGW